MNLRRLRWIIILYCLVDLYIGGHSGGLLPLSVAQGGTTILLASGGVAISCNAITAATSNNPGTSGGCNSAALLTSGSQLPSIYTWQVSTTGSPASIVVNFMGSLDGVTWSQIDTTTAAGTRTGGGAFAYRFLGCVPATMSGGSSPTLTCTISVTGSGFGTSNTYVALPDASSAGGLANYVNNSISGNLLGGRVNESMLETFATNPMPDNGFFKVTLPSGNGSSAAWTQSAPTVLRGGNWLIGNGRKGSNTSSDWIGSRMIPSNSFPDGIAPTSDAVTLYSCAGGAGSIAAGSYLVATVLLDNLQTYTGTSTVVPGQTNAGTEAIVTCGANGTITYSTQTIAGTAAAAGFGAISAVQMFLAPTVNATSSLSTTGATCAATPASCNVTMTVSALTNGNWARDFAVGENVIIDVGANQETQKIVAIDFINSKLVLQGPILHAHTATYPVAPSQSETLQNSTSGGSANAGATCTGTNASNAAYGSGFFACTISSGTNVSVVPTLTANIFNSNAVMPLINYTAPMVVFGSTGLQGTPEFDAKLVSTQVSCRRPNGTIVKYGLGWVNLDDQEHGFVTDSFVRDCPNGAFVFGNAAQNSSMVGVNEFNDGCATGVAASGCSGGSSAITNSNYRLVIQAVSPGPLGIDYISSSSANCLTAGCDYTKFAGAVVLLDRSATRINGIHGEVVLDDVRVRNKSSVHLTNPTGGSSNNATVIAALHVSTNAASLSTFNEVPQGAIEGIVDDVFAGPTLTTNGATTAGVSTTVTLTSTAGLYCGQEILMDTVASGVQEYVQIAGFSTAANTLPALSQCISGLVVTLASAVVNSHGAAVPFQPLSTAINEGTFVATGWYQLSNSTGKNSNRDRWTSYNGVPTILSGPNQFESSVATDVPLQLGSGPGVTQSGDLLDIYTDNFTTKALGVNSSGTLSTINALTTASFGVPIVVGATKQKTESASADTNVLTVTPAAVAGTYQVCTSISVNSATSGVISWTLSWTDAAGNAQTNIAMPLFQFGTAAPNTTFTTSSAGNYTGCPQIDVNSAGANIVVKWVGGGTTSAKMSTVISRLQ